MTPLRAGEGAAEKGRRKGGRSKQVKETAIYLAGWKIECRKKIEIKEFINIVDGE